MLKLPFFVARFAASTIGKITILALATIAAVLFSLDSSINIPTHHLDGAFQTASGLYRLNAGYAPGKDFLPYIGIGPLYVLYPAFALAGSDLAASVFGAQFTVLTATAMCLALTWHWIWRPANFLDSLLAACCLVLVAILLHQNFPNSVPWLLHPGNSLRPIRASMPYLAGGIFYFLILRISDAQLRYAMAGTLVGLAVLWSNDLALPTAGLLAVLMLVVAYRRKELCMRLAVVFGVTAVAAATISLSIATSGHPMALLSYNFSDVAHDQWWYFGPYGNETRVFSATDIANIISVECCFPLAILIATGIAAYRSRRIEHVMLWWVGGVLFAGGLLSSIGGHLGGYFMAFFGWGAGTAVLAVFRYLFTAAEKRFPFSQLRMMATIILLVVVGSACASSVMHFRQNLAAAQADPHRFFVPELGGYLSIEWQDYVSEARAAKGQVVFEEYWGLWSAIQRSFSPWPVDSVIHALGKTRLRAEDQLRAHADVIISTRSSHAKNWQPWSVSENYWFYGEALRHWSPYLYSPTTVVWKKAVHAPYEADAACTIDTPTEFLLDAPGPGFYEVQLQYSYAGRKRSIIMAKNNMNFAVQSGGYVSIDPRASHTLFPVYAMHAGENRFDISIRPSGQAVFFEASRCTARKLAIDNTEVLYTPLSKRSTSPITSE